MFCRSHCYAASSDVKSCMQVKTSILAERQSLEMPSVAPYLVGRPHRHAFFQSSRVAQASNWGAPQVDTAPSVSLLQVPKLSIYGSSAGAASAVQEAISHSCILVLGILLTMLWLCRTFSRFPYRRMRQRESPRCSAGRRAGTASARSPSLCPARGALRRMTAGSLRLCSDLLHPPLTWSSSTLRT